MSWVLTFILLAFAPSIALAEDSLIARIQKAQEAMVEVKTEFTKVLRTETDQNGVTHQVTFNRSGAGVVIDPSGIIVTNTHTVINAPFIFVILPNGQQFSAQVAYVSPVYDFSFLRINPSSPLKTIRWADSARINLGDPIVAVGNAELHSQGMLSGQVISLLQSKSSGDNEFIEININLYHGDSGGPIFDIQGRLLGIIMANRKSQDRVSLAIAINKIREEYWKYRKNMP